jgi:TPR repeat protein
MIVQATIQELKNAYKALLPQAKSGDSAAMVELALVCEQLDRPKYDRRDMWLERAAELKNTRAMSLLASRSRDRAKKIYWYEQAARNGETSHAPLSLVEIYEKGLGVPKDIEKIKYWYQFMIEHGNEIDRHNAKLYLDRLNKGGK